MSLRDFLACYLLPHFLGLESYDLSLAFKIFNTICHFLNSNGHFHNIHLFIQIKFLLFI